MGTKISLIRRFSRTALNILWKLGLAAMGVAAIFFTIFLCKELNRDNYSDSLKISQYVNEREKDGFIYLYNVQKKEYTLKNLDWISHGDSDDLICVYCKGQKRGFFRYDTGEALCEPVYDKAWNFNEGIAAIEKDGYVSFINKDFKPAFNKRFKIVRASDDWPEAITFQKGQCRLTVSPDSIGVLNAKGQWVIEPKYQFISELSTDSCRVVKLANKFGIIDYKGIVVIEPYYDAIRIPKPGVAIVAKDGIQKQISFDGTVLLDFIYDDIAEFDNESSNGYELYKVNGKWGVLHKKDCAVIIPALYESIEYLSGDHFKVLLSDEASASSNSAQYAPAYIVLDKNNHVVGVKNK
jgi:hypothetical protein